MADAWAELARSSPALDVYAKALRQTGCGANTPYVIHGLIRDLDRRFGSDSSQLAKIAAALLDEEHCPGAHGLSEVDKAKLREIGDPHPPVPPGPLPSTAKQ